MRICYITYTISPYNKGGADLYTEKIAIEMANRGHEVSIITCKPYFDGFSIKKEVRNNLTIYWTYLLNVGSFYSIGKRNILFQYLWRLIDVLNIQSYFLTKKLLSQINPDVVHTNTPSGFSPLIFNAVKSSKIKHVHTLHDYYLICPRITLLHSNDTICTNPNILCKMYRNYINKIISKPNKIIAVSEFVGNIHESIIECYNKAIIVIPNPLLMENIPNDQNKVPKDKEFFEILYVGQLKSHKGVQVLIRAFKEIEGNVHLNIIGDGSYRDNLEKLANGDKRIIFYGKQKYEDLFNFYRRCDLTIVPSITHESFGLTILESFSQGTPVIASDVGGIKEILKDGYNGLLVSPNNSDLLKREIIELIKDKNKLLEMKKNCIITAKEHIIEKHLEILEEIYELVVRENNEKGISNSNNI